jgi:uncharacterized protein
MADPMRDVQDVQVTHNEQASRFEATVQGQLSMAAYVRRGDVLVFNHTEVPPALRHHGIATALARAGLDHARSEGLGVDPKCPFIAKFIERNPESAPLVRR